MNTQYAPHQPPKHASYSPENGQVITEMPTTCTNYQCWKWEGSTRLSPILTKNENGFLLCPVCKRSYG